MDYWKLINKYITNEWTKNVYVTHVSLVTAKAIRIARSMNLDEYQIKFIEESAMLHDIGIIKVDDEEIGCTGELPYICHGSEGRKILENEGFPKHALVCERHTGVGLTKVEIIEQNLPIPHRDMMPESIEEKIISWADLFYSKDPKKLVYEKTMEEAYESVARFGDQYGKRFREWEILFKNNG